MPIEAALAGPVAVNGISTVTTFTNEARPGVIEVLIELPAITSDSARVKMDEEINSNPIGLFIYSKLFARPVLSTGVAGLLIIVIAGILFFKNPVPEYKYTQLEIEFAQKKLQASIAIVNKVFRKVGTELDKEVMPNRVGKHVNKGFNVLNDLLLGG